MTEWLSQGNIGRVILAVNHLSDKLRMEVAARQLGDRVVLSVEETPLGTGGPLKLAASLLDNSDPVVVVNGDVVTDIDLGALVRAHKAGGVEATIAVFSVGETKPFGLVTLDSDDRIVGFQEKSVKNRRRGWINAGVYILNQNVIEMIPSGRAVSLEREVFPVLADQRKLRGWRHTGFWYDVGTVQDYVAANMDLLKRRERSLREPKRGVPLALLEQPSYISGDCVVGTGAKLGPFTILSPKVKVENGASVRDSIVFESTVLGENCRIEGSVIGEATRIGRGAKIGKGSVVAGEVTVPDGEVLGPGSIVLN
jgi:mannose-1-phosphate guanylyltransferase